MADAGCLEVIELSKAFGTATVLDGVSFTVAASQRHGLIGVNGAGKTTLFNLITGDLAADGGEIRLDGQPITGLSIQARVLKGLGRTYQVSSLAPSLTVRAHLVLARGDGRLPSLLQPWRARGDDAELLATAEKFGLSGVLDELVSVLSHGAQRQLELAMVLYRRPRVLLLDEPGAGLSPSERALFARAIRALPRDVSVLMIEHDMDLILGLSDWITVLHNGRVLAAGEPAEIARNQAVRDVYLGYAHA